MAIKAFTNHDPADPEGSLRVVRVNLAAATGAAGLASIQNPFGVRAAVLDAVLDVTTPATGAATADIGVAATEISNDTLMDGVDIGTAAIFATAHTEHSGTPTGNAAGQVALAATGYVTATASADPAGIVGTLQVVFLKIGTVS